MGERKEKNSAVHTVWGKGTAPLTLTSQLWAFLVAQLVKNLPAMWETWV